MSALPFKLYTSIRQIDRHIWHQVVAPSRFFLSYDYFFALERSVKGIEFRYLVAEEQGKPVGVASFHIAPFKGEALMNYLPQQNGFIKSILRFGLKKIDVQLVTLGNLVSTGDKGWKFLTDNETALETILKGIADIEASIKNKTTGVMICKEGSDQNMALFKRFHLHPYKAEDEMHLYIPKNWSSFEDYEKAIHSKYRVRLHKVYQVGKDLTLQPLSLEQIIDQQQAIQQLFSNVLDHVKFKLVHLDIHYFIEMKKNLPDTFHVLGYYHQNKLVAFISYFLVHDDVDVHYIGIDYEFNQTFKLYNRILFDMTKIGILESKEMVCFGRTAHEIKSTVGAVPEPVYSYLRINNKLFNPLIPFFLKRLVPIPWIQRNPFK